MDWGGGKFGSCTKNGASVDRFQLGRKETDGGYVVGDWRLSYRSLKDSVTQRNLEIALLAFRINQLQPYSDRRPGCT